MTLAKELAYHFKDSRATNHADVKMQIGYDITEANWLGEPHIMPNARGMALLALWLDYVVIPLCIIRMHYCKHPNLESHGYANGDSGCDDFWCPDCGWALHHRYY